ncbi:hypothetical protein PIB30_051655 [Stylosanthes scabra]|uniref:Putative plant transposon protein domain-containing protein n=1 Tax=Stylosanthes scabra TaxID=79078 RepID=A0ABU6XFS5_9FABA|nr:hypothetical protein [Stylosanthes scabra]
MAGLLRKRKGKAVAFSSGEPPIFKTPYYEAHYKKFFIGRDVLIESRIEYEEESPNPTKMQIITRKWEKLARPIQGVDFNMIREFYANSWRLEEEKNQPKTYMTMVRGVDISFAPDAIRKVLKTRERPLPNVASYHDRKNEILRPEEVQEYLCEEGGEWVRHANGRPHYLKRNDLKNMARGWYDFVCKSIMPTTNRSELTVDRVVLIHSIMIGEDIRVEEIIADQIYKFVNKKNIRSKLAFPGIIAFLCREAKVKVPGDTFIPQESGIDAEAMARVREPRQPREPRQQRAAAPQQPPRQQPQPQVQQQEFPPNFYTHFVASMSQIYRRLDQQQEESRKSFEAINTRMDRMDDQLSFLCYSNQMVNETMYYPYQNTARQLREMEAQGVPMTIANLAIHRHREEEMNQERMRHNQTVQEAAAEKAREANKGKVREVVPDSDEDMDDLVSGESEEW